MVDPLRRAIEETRRQQDQHERAQYEVYDRLLETEEALSNRVRFFAVGVLMVSWGLLVQETGMEDPSMFDMRLILGAAILSVISLVFDFLYFTFRRGALRHAAVHRTRELDGSGPYAGFATLASKIRLSFFCLASVTLVYAVVTALLPILDSPPPY